LTVVVVQRDLRAHDVGTAVTLLTWSWQPDAHSSRQAASATLTTPKQVLDNIENSDEIALFVMYMDTSQDCLSTCYSWHIHT